MPVLAINVTTEVIDHAHRIIQEGRGTLSLARVGDRWELLPLYAENKPEDVAIIAGALLGGYDGSNTSGTAAYCTNIQPIQQDK